MFLIPYVWEIYVILHLYLKDNLNNIFVHFTWLKLNAEDNPRENAHTTLDLTRNTCKIWQELNQNCSLVQVSGNAPTLLLHFAHFFWSVAKLSKIVQYIHSHLDYLSTSVSILLQGSTFWEMYFLADVTHIKKHSHMYACCVN